MKLINFYLITKDNTTEYRSAGFYAHKSTKKKIVPIEEIIDKDFVAELTIDYLKEEIEHDIKIMSYDVESLMNWVKNQHPDIYELIPAFRVDQFQFVADEMKSSSSLSYTTVDPESSLEYQFGSEPEPDDFIPERESVKESIKKIAEKGFYTEIHCYPNSPVGFWNYYGTDFQSLLDHLIKD